jgi:hypothetical protein
MSASKTGSEKLAKLNLNALTGEESLANWRRNMGIRVGSYSCAAALETTITSSEPEFQIPGLLDRVGTKAQRKQIDESNKTIRARQTKMLDEASNAVGDMLKEIDAPSLSMIRNHQDWGTLSTDEGRYDLPAFIRLLMQIRNERGGQGSELAAAMSVLNNCFQHTDENISAYEQRYAEALRQAEDAGYVPPVDVVACVGHFTNRLREADKRKVEAFLHCEYPDDGKNPVVVVRVPPALVPFFRRAATELNDPRYARKVSSNGNLYLRAIGNAEAKPNQQGGQYSWSAL